MEFILNKLKKKWGKQFLLYCIIGVTGVIIDFILFFILTHFTNVSVQVANFISTSAGIINNFLLNTLFNFKVKNKIFLRFFSFYATGLLGLGLSVLGLHFLVGIFNAHELPAKAITIVYVVIIQFFINKFV